jgi:hypothetical protein
VPVTSGLQLASKFQKLAIDIKNECLFVKAISSVALTSLAWSLDESEAFLTQRHLLLDPIALSSDELRIF